MTFASCPENFVLAMSISLHKFGDTGISSVCIFSRTLMEGGICEGAKQVVLPVFRILQRPLVVQQDARHVDSLSGSIAYLIRRFFEMESKSKKAPSSSPNHMASISIDHLISLKSDKDTIDTVLKKFLTSRRMPPYKDLTDAERKVEYAKEIAIPSITRSRRDFSSDAITLHHLRRCCH